MVKRYSRKPSKRKYKVSKRTRKNTRKRSKGKNTRKKLRGGSRLVFYGHLIDKLSHPYEELKKKLWRELKPKDQVILKQLGYSEGNWSANVKRTYDYKDILDYKNKYNIDFPKGDFIKLLELQYGLNSAESPNLFSHFKELGWEFSGGHREFKFKSGKSEFKPDDHTL